MFLDTEDKKECFGCEACAQICGKHAISMEEDAEGFRYPVIDHAACVECGKCREVCPYEHSPVRHEERKLVFGGYHQDQAVRFDSTSGGAFSAIVDAFCDEQYQVFGAEAKGMEVFHDAVSDKKDAVRFRKSKYSQSHMGTSYQEARKALREGRKVLFSGTPCQVAGLLSFLGNEEHERLLTVEVVCEGVPSPLYIRAFGAYIKKKYGKAIESIDYRYTGRSFFNNGKWDFEGMKLTLEGREKPLIKDRWFLPFWSIWLKHLMSRPSCYHCPFASIGRTADITLGDLWGVHLYCPDLYGKNGGSSLVLCNTDKGKEVFQKAREQMHGHELALEDAVRYQSPLRKVISGNPDRALFMQDLQSGMEYQALNRKWAPKPTVKLLVQKYVWGNRQKIMLWRVKQRLKRKKGSEYA